MYPLSIVAVILMTILRVSNYFMTHWSGKEAQVNGRPYRYKLVAAHSKQSPYSRVAVPLETKVRLTIRPEGWWERVLKWAGFASEFHTGHSEFDTAYFIECDHAGVCAMLQLDDAARKMVGALLGKKDRKLMVAANGLSLLDDEDVLTLAEAEAVAVQLYELKGKLESALIRPSVPKGRTAAHFVVLVHMLLLTGVFAVLWDIGGEVHFVSYGQILKETAIAAALIGASWLIIISLLLGRTVLGRRAVVDFLAFGLPAIALLTYVGLVDINVKYDTAPGRQFTLPVIKKYTTRGKRSTYYHVYVRHWDNPSYTYDIESHALFNSVNVGSNVSLTVHPGYLQYPWLTDIRPAR